MSRAVFLYSDRFGRFKAYDGYPWIFSRSDVTMELCRKMGLLGREDMELRTPEPAPPNDLLEYHKEEYLSVLERANSGEFQEWMLEIGIGTMECPVYRGCYDYHRLIVGSSLMGADSILREGTRVVFGPTGGMHHAGEDFASGFCYLNDAVLAVKRLMDAGMRILYVDIDAHHGDMVQEAFYREDRVLNVSFHEDPQTLFPHNRGFVEEIGEGAGRGFNINVPMPAGTGDEVFVRMFEQIFPPVAEAFRPDVVVAALGADGLASDPMSNLRITTEGYCRAVELIAQLSPRILALGSGGYVLETISRAWTLAWAILNRIPISDDTELLYGGVFRGDSLPSLKDQPVFIPEQTRRVTMERCEAVASYIRSTHFALLGV
jgi:acetoin utilization protein AcuC